MPAKDPFLSCTLGNRLLLKALHDEMKEKEIITQTILHKRSEPVTSSSGVHSNSLSEESEEEKYFGSLNRRPKNRQTAMARAAAEAGSRKTKLKDDSYDSGNLDKNDMSSSSGNGDLTVSSDEEIQSASSDNREDYSWLNKRSKRKQRKERMDVHELQQQKQKVSGFLAQQKINLEDKEDSLDYTPSGVSFGARMSAFRKVIKAPTQIPNAAASQALVFPLEDAAAGEGASIEAKEMKKIERAAKQKTKMEKKAIAEAKLTVSEAKLTEFEAKLRARQARIEESHARLCNRRAMIKLAEERILTLEARLDEEEECQRERERKVKNRDRRVKQEEEGYQIKIASLNKREKKIVDDLKHIERRKQLVEERESDLLALENTLAKNEAAHFNYGRKNRGHSSKVVEKVPNKPNPDGNTDKYASLGRNKESRGRSRQKNSSSHQKGAAPIPTPRKSLEGKGVLTVERKKRSNSLDSETMLGEEEFSSRPERHNPPARQEKYQVGSLPRRKNKYSISGLWL